MKIFEKIGNTIKWPMQLGISAIFGDSPDCLYWASMELLNNSLKPGPADCLTQALFIWSGGSQFAALAVVAYSRPVFDDPMPRFFALGGTELRSLLTGSDQANMRATKSPFFGIFYFIVLVFSQPYMTDELVLLARVSFTGNIDDCPQVVLGALFSRIHQKVNS